MTKKKMSETTKLKLQEAFWDLYENKRIEQISVREITDLAGCNRGTFYLYYKDIYDILAQCEKSLWEELYRPLACGNKQAEAMTSDELMQLVTDTYAKQKRYMLILFGDHGDPAFHRIMKNNLKSLLATHLNYLDTYDPIAREYLLEFYASGAISILTKWFHNESDMTLEQFIKLIKDSVMLPLIQMNNQRKGS